VSDWVSDRVPFECLQKPMAWLRHAWAKKYPLEPRVSNFRLPSSGCARLTLFDTDWVGLRSLLMWMRKWVEFCVNIFFWIWGIFYIFTVKIQTVDWVSKQQLEIAVGHRVVVKSFSGSKAMKDYLKPNLELSQDQVILHVDTNDLEQKKTIASCRLDRRSC